MRIHGHCCSHRYAHSWPIDTRIYGHSCPHRCAHTPIYGLYICVYMMFHDRPYRRQRPPGTTPNASNFWFPDSIDSREIYAGVTPGLCDTGYMATFCQVQLYGAPATEPWPWMRALAMNRVGLWPWMEWGHGHEWNAPWPWVECAIAMNGIGPWP